MAEAGHNYDLVPEREPVDPGNVNLAAAIKAVVEMFKPTPTELAHFGEKLAYGCVSEGSDVASVDDYKFRMGRGG